MGSVLPPVRASVPVWVGVVGLSIATISKDAQGEDEFPNQEASASVQEALATDQTAAEELPAPPVEPELEAVIIGKRRLSRDRTEDGMRVEGQQLRDSARFGTFEALSQRMGDMYVPGRGAMHGVGNGATGGIRIRGLGGSPNSQVLVVEDGVPD